MAQSGNPRDQRPGLAAKVAFLREPGSYPEPCFRVEARETHMSWVFLLDAHVYKLKKPVCHGVLDFRALRARRFFCEEEVRLNARLAPAVYLGVVPLSLDRERHLRLGPGATVVDWLVRMRRLPAARMLDEALLRGNATPADLERLAATLAGFYRALAPERIACADYAARFVRQAHATFDELGQAVFALPADALARLRAAQLGAVATLRGSLDARVRAGRIVEGHGDLRPEHACLTDPPAVIDCLEFSRPLRILDVLDELGFLALECERLGAGPAGEFVLRRCALLSGDTAPPALLHFYQACRASTRALISARHLLDRHHRHSPHWQRRARQYLELAGDHFARLGSNPG